MPRWLVELKGDPFVTEDLPYFFPAGESHAITEGDKCYLVSSHFEGLASPQSVNDRAQQLVDELSSVMAVHLGYFVRPHTGPVYFEDESGNRNAHYFLKVDNAIHRSKVRSNDTRRNRPTAPQRMLAAATSPQAEHLKIAMLIWADERKTWPRLYRVVEELHQHFGTSPDRAGLCDKAQLKRFTRTANCAEVAGIDARHALRQFRPPADPMTLPEASEFVRGLLLKALGAP